VSAAEILELGVAELARRIEAGDVTSVAATTATLDALEAQGPRLNAVARLHREDALAAAETADAERRAGKLRGPLHGVPLAHKDLCHRAGRPTEMGSTIFKGYVPEVTATVIQRLDKAGAIDIGRLNMVEFALGITGHNPHTGHPRNAWDETRVTGGSTSGGATAVAARLAFATLGSDTGGSIRIPSSLCNLVGLKATYGRVSRWGCMPLSCSLDHVGPLARSAEDCALILGAIAGYDPNDRSTSPRPVPDYRQGFGPSLRGLRIGIARMDASPDVDAVILRLMGEAMAAFRSLGAGTEDRALPPLGPLNAARRVVMLGEATTFHRELIRTRRADYNQETLGRMEPGFALAADDYVAAAAARGPVLRAFCRDVFAGVDILALPSCPVQTPTIAETDTGGDARFVAVANAMGALVGPFNYLGLPALSVPMGFDGNGMPVGLQLVGRPFAEARLLEAAHAFEQATGWSRRRPQRR
jgi:aspartyl-tRNA(Asn)/glutamyl-tRNA(Gln) amidotransferase subunit A